MANATLRPKVPLTHADGAEHRRLIAQRVNVSLPDDGTAPMTAPLVLASYAVADLPDPALWEGALVYVSDEAGGFEICYSDGTDWRPLLADYLAGTWTPALAFGGGSTGLTYAEQAGHFTKIGQLVVYTGHISLSNKGSSSGEAVISGLPYAPVGNVAGACFFDALAPGAGLVPQLFTSGTSIHFRALDPATGANGVVTDAAFANTTVLRFTISSEI